MEELKKALDLLQDNHETIRKRIEILEESEERLKDLCKEMMDRTDQYMSEINMWEAASITLYYRFVLGQEVEDLGFYLQFIEDRITENKEKYETDSD